MRLEVARDFYNFFLGTLHVALDSRFDSTHHDLLMPFLNFISHLIVDVGRHLQG